MLTSDDFGEIFPGKKMEIWWFGTPNMLTWVWWCLANLQMWQKESAFQCISLMRGRLRRKLWRSGWRDWGWNASKLTKSCKGRPANALCFACAVLGCNTSIPHCFCWSYHDIQCVHNVKQTSDEFGESEWIPAHCALQRCRWFHMILKFVDVQWLLWINYGYSIYRSTKCMWVMFGQRSIICTHDLQKSIRQITPEFYMGYPLL